MTFQFIYKKMLQEHNVKEKEISHDLHIGRVKRSELNQTNPKRMFKITHLQEQRPECGCLRPELIQNQ